MKTKLLVVFSSLPFLIFIFCESRAQTLDDATAIAEYKLKEIEYTQKYDGLYRDIKIKEAWLEYQQKKNIVMSAPRGGELSERDMRDHLVDKGLIDDLSLTGRELTELRRRYYQELYEVNQRYRVMNFDGDIDYCRFDKVEGDMQSVVSTLSRRYPDAIVVRDAQDARGALRSKINARKTALTQAEQATMEAITEGNKCREFCVIWNVPAHLLQSDVLLKCKPQLISEMRQVSELSKRAEEGFRGFKVKRAEALSYGESCVRECRDLGGAMERINTLNPYPFNKCAEYMLRQESGPDASEYVKKNIDLRYNDLLARMRRINEILPLTNNVILNCDWNTLGRMKQDALQALPEENCIRNYPVFANLRNSINDLDRKREVRINELRPLANRMLKNIDFCEGYFKIPAVNPNIPYNQPSWDENRVNLYNDERTALDFAVREAFTQGYGNCLRDLIARANALPPRIQVTARPRRRFDNPMLGGRPLDHCLSYGRNCDKPAADEFCRRNGLQKAVEWNVTRVQYTNILSGEKCDIPAKCDAFTFVVCE
jgi:hypothetical protein